MSRGCRSSTGVKKRQALLAGRRETRRRVLKGLRLDQPTPQIAKLKPESGLYPADPLLAARVDAVCDLEADAFCGLRADHVAASPLFLGAFDAVAHPPLFGVPERRLWVRGIDASTVVEMRLLDASHQRRRPAT